MSATSPAVMPGRWAVSVMARSRTGLGPAVIAGLQTDEQAGVDPVEGAEHHSNLRWLMKLRNGDADLGVIMFIGGARLTLGRFRRHERRRIRRLECKSVAV